MNELTVPPDWRSAQQADSAWEWRTSVSTKLASLARDRAEWAVLDWLAPFRTVLEIGCGRGRYTGFTAGRQTIVGLEYTREYVQHCARHVAGYFLRGDGFNVPLRSHSFDAVFSTGVIEHFDDPLALVREHTRVCRPGGVVMICVPAKDSPDATLFHLVREQFSARKEVDSDWHLYGRRMGDDEVKRLLESAGLARIGITHAGPPLRRRARVVGGFLRELARRPSVAAFKGATLSAASVILARRPARGWALRHWSATRGQTLIGWGTKPAVPGTGDGAAQPIESHGDLFAMCICPRCHTTGLEQTLTVHRQSQSMKGGAGILECERCTSQFPIVDGVPFLAIDDAMANASE